MITITCYCSGSSGNLYLVRNNDTKILLECGVDEKTIRNFLKQEGVNISTLDACLISHKHKDHTQSMDYISQFIDIYACQQVFSDKKISGGNVLFDKQNFKIGNIKIKPIAINHGVCDNMGFIFKDSDNCIFWATDFSILAPANSQKITDLSNFRFDEIWIECNYITEYLIQDLNKAKEERNVNLERKLTRQLNTHMSLENCVKHLKTFNLEKCKSIHLIHISFDVGNKEIMRKTIETEIGVPTFCNARYGG